LEHADKFNSEEQTTKPMTVKRNRRQPTLDLDLEEKDRLDIGAGGISITQQLDAEELVAGWRAIEAQRPRLHARLSIGCKTDLGRVRENNEDKYDLLEPREPGILAIKGRLYGVADGMGGHSAGQIASELALKTLIRTYFNDESPDVIDSLHEAMSSANLAVHEDAQVLPERQGMGTTLTAAVIQEDHLYVGHVGDSRGYLIRDGQTRQITQDHSWVAEQVRIGGMTLQEALASPFRNIILRSIGTGPAVDPDFYELEIQIGDVILLCTDGLTTHLEDAEISEQIASDYVSQIGPSVAALRLVNAANDRGGRDNITVVLIYVESIDEFASQQSFTGS
jgi:protein phosphatase